jgi:hypothetical protein
MLQEAMSLSQLKKTSKKCPRCQMGIEKNGSAQTYHLTFAFEKRDSFRSFSLQSGADALLANIQIYLRQAQATDVIDGSGGRKH